MRSESGLHDLMVDGHGYAVIVKLVESRVNDDIGRTRELLSAAVAAEGELQADAKEGFLAGIRTRRATKKVEQLLGVIGDKERWRDQWLAMAWGMLEDGEADRLRNTSIQTLLATYFGANDELYSQRFILLQEALFTPIYAMLDDFPKGLKEEDRAAGEELMASLAGFPENIVRDMDGAVDGFLKDVAEFWTRVVKLSLGNGRSVLVAAAAAAPDLAAAVAEARRSARPDAPVQAEGLTFFGGGAVVVSELESGHGMGSDAVRRPDDELGTTGNFGTPTTFAADGGSGPYFEYDDDYGEDRESDRPVSQVATEATSETRAGLHVLIGGGALLGAAGMPGAATALTALAKEALAVQLAKVVSYAGFLKSQQHRSSAAAGVLARLQTQFLHLKHNVEREILLGAVDDKASEADVERTLRMLDRAYHWLRKND